MVIKHLSLTLLTSVKGVTIQRWHDWHPLGGRKTLWFAWLDAPIPVEGWACGWVAASYFPKRIGENHWLISPWMLGTDFYWILMILREKNVVAQVAGETWDLGSMWGRPSMAEIGFIGKVQTWSWEFGRFKSTTSPNFWPMEWRKGRNEIGKKKEIRNRNRILITFLFGGFWMHSRMVLKFPDSRWHILTLFTKQAFPASASKTQPYWDGQS